MTDKKPTPEKPQAPERSPLERTADLTRRIIAVPKAEAVKLKKKRR